MKKNTKSTKRKEKVHSNTIFCNDIELIINYIYNNSDLTKAQIKDIVDAQFRMLKDVTRSGGLINKDSEYKDFSSIRLIRLGNFSPSEKKFYAIKEGLEKKGKLDV